MLILVFVSIIYSINAIEPSIIISTDSSYSCQHINLIWSVTQNTFPLSFQYKTSDAKVFSTAIITEISQQVYSINDTFNFQDQTKNCSIQFRFLMDKPDDKSSYWSEIFEFQVSETNLMNWNKYHKYGYYALGGVVALGGSMVALPLLGFTAGGIAAGSVAATVHSSIGVIATGSAFAGLQSAGMAGMSLMTQGIITTLGVGIAGVAVETVGEDKVDEIIGDFSETGQNTLDKINNAANKFREWFGGKEDSDDPITDKINKLEEWYQNGQIENEKLNEDQIVYVWFKEKVSLGIYTNYYYQLFLQNGFDSMEEIKKMTRLDLEEIGISKESHFKYILKEINELAISDL